MDAEETAEYLEIAASFMRMHDYPNSDADLCCEAANLLRELKCERDELRELLREARTVTADALHDSLSGGRRTYSSVLSDLLSRIDKALGGE